MSGAAARMHVDEFLIDEYLVRRLVDEQFPRWAGLPLRQVEPGGTVHDWTAKLKSGLN